MDPWLKISHIVMPKLHTSERSSKNECSKDSGDIHLSGSGILRRIEWRVEKCPCESSLLLERPKSLTLKSGWILGSLKVEFYLWQINWHLASSYELPNRDETRYSWPSTSCRWQYHCKRTRADAAASHGGDERTSSTPHCPSTWRRGRNGFWSRQCLC